MKKGFLLFISILVIISCCLIESYALFSNEKWPVRINDAFLPSPLWIGTGDLTLTVNKEVMESNFMYFGDIGSFDGVYFGTEALDSSCYEMRESDGGFDVTFREAYLNRLSDGVHRPEMRFSGVIVDAKLYIDRNADPGRTYSFPLIGSTAMFRSPAEGIFFERPLLKEVKLGEETLKEDDYFAIATGGLHIDASQELLNRLGEDGRLTVTFQNATAILIPVRENFQYGDVNKDGKVNSRDARTVLRFAAKNEAIPDDETLLAADVIIDNSVSSADARKILRSAAHIDILEF